MADYPQIEWKSEEAVDGVFLTAVFILPLDQSGSGPVSATFSCNNSVVNRFEVLLPLDGSRIPLRFVFRNGMELKGSCWVVHFTEEHGINAVGVTGDLSFGWTKTPGSMISCQGMMAAFSASPPPLSPSPEIPHIIVEPGIQEVANAFPYIFLRKWTGNCHRKCCTVLYTLVSSPPQNTLYECLLQATPPTWAVLQNIVDLYLNGDLLTDFPYLCSITQLDAPIADFHQVYRDLQLQWPFEDPRMQILSLLGISEEQLLSYLRSPEYASSKQRCWQNYFALVIKMGYLMELLQQLAETLLAAFVIEWVFLAQQGASFAPADFKRHLDATIVLPAALFPLPSPVISAPDSPPACNLGNAQAFAIGELQLLQITLVRYQPGDLARVVNVLARERREHSRRWREESQRLEEEKSISSMGKSSATNAEISQLFRQALESAASQNLNAAYNNFNVTYGSPATATLSGGWSEQLLPGTIPGDRNLQRLGYELADRSRIEVSRQVERLRIERTLRETEENDTSVIDNTGSDENRTYVYRWLDRIYSAQVYQSGLRLILRFSIPHPAKDFTWAGQKNSGPPVRLQDLGISHCEQINPLNYSGLLARYHITHDLAPPANKTVSSIVRLNESKEIYLPDGYQAVSACVTPAAAANYLPVVNGVIGRETFGFPPLQSVSLSLTEEEQTLPLVLMGPGISGSPPEPFPANEFAATVEVECQASPTLMREWKMRVYEALVRGFEEQMDRYRKEAGLATSGEHGVNPALLKGVQRQELRRRCLCILEKMNLEPYTFASPPVPEIAEDFAVVNMRFFEEVLQWDLMTFRYLSSGSCCLRFAGGGSDDLKPDLSFAQFLQAESAIVLVPADPRHALAALYYLRTGMVWTGLEHLAPINASDTNLACELKSIGVAPARPIGEPWEIAVPTSEQVVMNKLPCS